MFIVTVTAKEENAKRFMVSKHNTFDEAYRHYAMLDNTRYIYEIVNGKWEVLARKGEEVSK